jgi:hypothetical protein
MRMTSKVKKQSKLVYFALTPIRILKKATDFYMKSMEDFAGRVGYGGAVGGQAGVTRLPKSFSVNSSHSSDDEDSSRLLRSVSRRNVDMHRQQVVIRQSNMGGNGMGMRSCSVGLGKIGRIDEDMPCYFEEDEINVKAELYPRSKSYAVQRNGVYH